MKKHNLRQETKNLSEQKTTEYNKNNTTLFREIDYFGETWDK